MLSFSPRWASTNGHVQETDADLQKLTESLGSREYDTATSGTRKVEPCRAVGEGGVLTADLSSLLAQRQPRTNLAASVCSLAIPLLVQRCLRAAVCFSAEAAAQLDTLKG